MFGAVAARLAGLRVRYAEPHRAYHGQGHIDAMLAGLAAVGADAPAAAELATWYHDAVYDPAATDNEDRSAALLLSEMAGLADAALLDRAAALVRLTAAHVLPPGLPPDLVGDAAVFLDLDMAVLGAEGAVFDAYERGIAAEYVPVHGTARFRAGRRRFLEGLLARPRLFLTDAAQARLDGPARGNIRRVLAAPGPG